MAILGISGHRPKYWGYTLETAESLKILIKDILVQDPPTKVITGMALGMDVIAAEACKDLKIPYVAAIPFVGQEAMWPQEAKDKYYEVLAGAQLVVTISNNGFDTSAFKKRNEYIVSNCHRMLVLYNGARRSGTGHAVGLATKRGIPIQNIWEQFLQACGQQDV